jgi:dTDP-4-dehydrorhamnose 3,5-epimerase-like enzyme
MAHPVLRPRFERRDSRGVFREIVSGFPAGTVVCGRMGAGAVMGNHYHRRTRVFFYLLAGRAGVRTVDIETGHLDKFLLGENQGVFLEPGESHAIRFLVDSEFLMLKSLPYDPQDPDTFAHPVPGENEYVAPDEEQR